jgi:hypothetical protein
MVVLVVVVSAVLEHPVKNLAQGIDIAGWLRAFIPPLSPTP